MLGGVVALASFAVAQESPQGVVLKSHIGLATFGAGSGNDCWGYVSPSGREYAIVGLNNMVAFVEVTDPSNPVVVEKIPHGSSGWGDIKVYGHFAYAVTEKAGTGLQVIDMSAIDDGVVTLVRTLDTISRAHNVVMDEENGFLYSVGTRGGTGTTVCFSLADPANPVQVGAASITERYQHDAQVVTYEDGPLAGKQIWFGFSEGRGVDVYDVTDKDNPTRINRIEYPDMGYCHQGWLSEDRKYLYVDDEFDENQQGVPTRSLIFNVEDPLNATYVGTFTSGLQAIDHNQYIVDGFAFQANYRSGLRIFDVASNPESPVQIGWYDTFAPNDNAGFDGAWSNYPFFPSGTVIVSDINDGLFVFDVTGATTRTVMLDGVTVSNGVIMDGGQGNLAEADGDVLKIGVEKSQAGRLPLTVVMSGTAYDNSPMGLKFEMDVKSDKQSLTQQLWIYNWESSQYELAGKAVITKSGSTVSFEKKGNLSKYVNADTREVRVKATYSSSQRGGGDVIAFLDRAVFKITR